MPSPPGPAYVVSVVVMRPDPTAVHEPAGVEDKAVHEAVA
jgi:hypothetical protein